MSSSSSRDRFYSAPPATHNVSMEYGWSPAATQTGGANTVTGNWMPLQLDSNGNLAVAIAGGVTISGGSVPIQAISGFVNVLGGNTAPINISGVVQSSPSPLQAISGYVTTIVTGGSVSFDSSAIVNAQATGNNLAVISNQLLSGISGSLTSNLSSAAWVTGQIQLTGTLPVSIVNTVLTTQVTGFNTGAIVTTDVRSSAVAGNSTPSGTGPYTSMSAFAFGQALAANANRAELFIQNIHTGIPLYVNFGAVAASTGAFSMILNPSTVQGWAGTSFGTRSWRGPVTVSGGAWIAWEL